VSGVRHEKPARTDETDPAPIASAHDPFTVVIATAVADHDPNER
jgi:hypothetical protein